MRGELTVICTLAVERGEGGDPRGIEKGDFPGFDGGLGMRMREKEASPRLIYWEIW